MAAYKRIEDAAADKSSTWPQGEPQAVRDAADKARQAEEAARTAKTNGQR